MPDQMQMLRDEIQRCEVQSEDSAARAHALFQQGMRTAGRIPTYFGDLLDSNARALHEALLECSLAEAAGWDDERWRHYDASQVVEPDLLRVGCLTDPRRDGQIIAPAYVPFI
ncbi:MAG TPA: hypothetical protein VNL71_10290, partial [Chloroflexota bacterium]|nr:hypothetical protein [Chloroflexota bacterium]